MNDRSELVEAALDVYPEGLALLDPEGRIVFWNRTAETMTGYTGADILGRLIPEALESLTICRDYEMHGEPRNGPQLGRGSLVHAQHKQGHDVPAIARRVILRDGLGERIGTAAVFHPARTVERASPRRNQRRFRSEAEPGGDAGPAGERDTNRSSTKAGALRHPVDRG